MKNQVQIEIVTIHEIKKSNKFEAPTKSVSGWEHSPRPLYLTAKSGSHFGNILDTPLELMNLK